MSTPRLLIRPVRLDPLVGEVVPGRRGLGVVVAGAPGDDPGGLGLFVTLLANCRDRWLGVSSGVWQARLS
jgi:hypothetical protein